LTPGIEVTTGPLGQGFANSVGLASAEAHMSARFNKPDFPIFDNFTYVILGDGCMMEGVTSEAASLAGHLGLEKLIAFYDDNKITIDGSTDMAFSENVADRFKAYGFHVIHVENGDKDLEAISNAIVEAKNIKGKPKLIILRTTIGIHSKVAGTAKAHGAPLGAEDVANVKKILGFDPEKHFYIPSEVSDYYHRLAVKGKDLFSCHKQLMEEYCKKFHEEASLLNKQLNKTLPTNLLEVLPKYESGGTELATRKCSEMSINSFANLIPGFVGGSADLTESNLTTWKKDCGDFQKASYDGRYFRYGVREHGNYFSN
jgi:transketolase